MGSLVLLFWSARITTQQSKFFSNIYMLSHFCLNWHDILGSFLLGNFFLKIHVIKIVKPSFWFADSTVAYHKENWEQWLGRNELPQIAKFMGPIWGRLGSCRPQMGPMLAQWTLLSGPCYCHTVCQCNIIIPWLVAQEYGKTTEPAKQFRFTFTIKFPYSAARTVGYICSSYEWHKIYQGPCKRMLPWKWCLLNSSLHILCNLNGSISYIFII